MSNNSTLDLRFFSQDFDSVELENFQLLRILGVAYHEDAEGGAVSEGPVLRIVNPPATVGDISPTAECGVRLVIVEPTPGRQLMA